MDKRIKGRLIDGLLLAMVILPFAACIALKVLTRPVSDGINITGAQVYFTIPMPFQPLYITEAQTTSAAVIVSLLGLCLYLTRGMTVTPGSRRQLIAEWIVETVNGLIKENMGERFMGFAPFVAGIMGLSALSSLSSLLGLFPPTSDLNIVFGWAILVFGLITHYKLKGGLAPYLKGFLEPFFLFAPFNVIGEIATPVSMSFRHFGNVVSGVVISTMMGALLQAVSNFLLGWLPGFLGDIPFLQVGIPAVFSLYFDIFSGLMQAYIFAILTMLYIANGFPEEDYNRRMARRREKRGAHAK